MSVLFITHDMGVVAEIADRTVVMYRGEAVEDRRHRRHFCARPATLYARAAFGRAAARLDGWARLACALSGGRHGDWKRSEPPRGGRYGRAATARRSSKCRTSPRVSTSMAGCSAARAGAIHAVENVSFDSSRARRWRWSGESGCGKSTTGRSITRLVEPNGGVVRLDGRMSSRWTSRPCGASAPQHPDGLPGSVRQPQSAHDGRRGHGRTDRRARHRPARGEHATRRRNCSSGSASAGHDDALSARILGRPATAHLHRPGPRARPQGDRRR